MCLSPGQLLPRAFIFQNIMVCMINKKFLEVYFKNMRQERRRLCEAYSLAVQPDLWTDSWASQKCKISGPAESCMLTRPPCGLYAH